MEGKEFKVLVADDSAFARKVVTSHLAGSEFVVVGEATTGDEAVDLYRSLQPDMVMLDIIMPDKTGAEAIAEISSEHEGVKAVMLSSLGTEEMVTQCLDAGATTFPGRESSGES